MNRSESKYFNTAVRMGEALMSLLEKKEFDYISIKEVCAEAGVNRSTFYLHYETMRDLLDETVEWMQKLFLSYFETAPRRFMTDRETCPKEELYLITPEYLTPYLKFVYDHRRLYRAALVRPGDFHADAAYRAMYRDVFDPILCRFAVPVEERRPLMSFYIGGITAVVSDWLKEDCKAPIDHVIGIILHCIRKP